MLSIPKMKKDSKNDTDDMAWYLKGNSERHEKYANYLLGMLLIYLVALGIYTLHDD
jgi:uncharacterized FlgJ-related protein